MTTSVNVTNRPRPPREVAVECWGTLPDWVEAVVREVERTSGVKTAGRIGYSGGVVSQVLRRNYPGDIDRVEAAVRGALMGEKVDCPALEGMEIPRDRCLREQEMPRTTASPQRMRFWRECRGGCPHSRIKGVDDAAQ